MDVDGFCNDDGFDEWILSEKKSNFLMQNKREK